LTPKPKKPEPEASGQTPALLDAVNLTSRVLEGRMRLYRNLVVAVSLVSLLSMLSALLCWHPWPLAGLILLPALTGGFLVLDSRRVSQWHDEIMRMCQTRALDLPAFVDLVSRLTHLPSHSVQGMLDTLPPKDTVGPQSKTDSPTAWGANWRTLAGAASATVALAAVVGALCWRSWWPLFVAGACASSLAFLRKS
jgi:hypothetical protein